MIGFAFSVKRGYSAGTALSVPLRVAAGAVLTVAGVGALLAL